MKLEASLCVTKEIQVEHSWSTVKTKRGLNLTDLDDREGKLRMKKKSNQIIFVAMKSFTLFMILAKD